MRYRLLIEVEYLILLGKEKGIKELSAFSKNQKHNLRKLYKNFTDADAKKIIKKKLESDVDPNKKQICRFFQERLANDNVLRAEKRI